MNHFKPFELVDKATYEALGDEGSLKLFNPEALLMVDDLAEYFHTIKSCAVIVNNWASGGQMQWRGYRTPEKAIELGAPHSAHAFMRVGKLWLKKGNAFDCTIIGFPADEARKIITADKDHELLKRIMRLEDGVSWVHADCEELPEGVERICLFNKRV